MTKPFTIEQFSQMLPLEGALIGLDPGTKTIGIAVSDTSRAIATALETITRHKFAQDIEHLQAIITERRIAGLIIGMPVNMDGSQGPRAQSVRAFTRNLETYISLPIAYWDERLSTAAVEKSLIAADTTRSRRAELVDRMAAAYILQGALDRLAGCKERT